MSVKATLDLFYKGLIKHSRSNLSKKGHNFSKKLYNSLDYEVKEFKNSFHSSLSMEDYGDFKDKGVRGAGGVRKTTSKFKKTNNKGKLWKIKAKNSKYKYGKSGGISAKHFKGWAAAKGISPFAVAKAVYHQGIETTNFYSHPFELAFKKLPDDLVEAYGLELDKFLEASIR